MFQKVILRFLALALLLVAALANRGSKLEQSAVSKDRPFRRQGWGLSSSTTKDNKPVKEGKPVGPDQWSRL
jgi:hypothetical protein